MLESIFATTDTRITLFGLMASLGVALILGVFISLVHMKTDSRSGKFSATLIILPAVITIIILLIGNSVARAFSLAGAFTIVRFRSIPTSPKGIIYVLISMAIGLACGMGFLAYAVIACIMLCVVMIIIKLVKYGNTGEKLLKITCPESLEFENAFAEVFDQFTTNYSLKKIKTDALGSLYKLQYFVSLKKDVSEKAFIDELRCRNGNLNISLSLDYESEEQF